METKFKLTDAFVAGLTLPPGKVDHTWWDADVPLFGVRLRKGRLAEMDVRSLPGRRQTGPPRHWRGVGDQSEGRPNDGGLRLGQGQGRPRPEGRKARGGDRRQ